jgi:hypothetical protein
MGAGTNTGSVARNAGNRAKVGLVSSLAIAAILVVPATAFAAKSGGTAPYIRLATTDGAAFAASQPRLGSSVKFATGYPTGTKNPWVSVTCYQGGVMVYAEGGIPASNFVLGGASSDWAATGGAASCQAELGDLYWRGGHQYYTYLATTNFDAGA